MKKVKNLGCPANVARARLNFEMCQGNVRVSEPILLRYALAVRKEFSDDNKHDLLLDVRPITPQKPCLRAT